ncbi:hypothetical protein D3C72_2212940 [compost metagenome]
MGRCEKMAPPSLLSTRATKGAFRWRVAMRAPRSCRKARSPVTSRVGRSRPIAAQRAVEVMPSMPFAPRLTST